jgi:hypothetical protein
MIEDVSTTAQIVITVVGIVVIAAICLGIAKAINGDADDADA